MNLIFISSILVLSFGLLLARDCTTDYDPFITTFDGMRYGFQYSGDHYIMYDDFRGVRITTGFQPCGSGSCNCAIYLKKDTKLIFVDFCNVASNLSPTSKLYGVSVEKNHIGPKAIREVPLCPVISSLHENNQATWELIPTFLGKFKCARLQGNNYFTFYVLRTVENNFADSVKIKFQLGNRAIPTLSITQPNSAYGRTGGLCGRWDGSASTDLFVLDKDGIETFLGTSNLPKIRDFWHLNSVYNKDDRLSKRCPECSLMAERSFYCPCDEFNLFDNTNYNLYPSNRSRYCKVPMHVCVEKNYNLIIPTTSTTTTKSTTSTRPISGANSTTTSNEGGSWASSTTDDGSIWIESTITSGWNETFTTTIPTTIAPIDPDTAHQLCFSAFMNHTGLSSVLNSGCLDTNTTIQFCIDDVTLTSDPSFINIHIEASIDITIQNILTNQSNCSLTELHLFCPNGCSNNGVCQFRPQCLLPGIISEDCATIIHCVCDAPYGGSDCSQDLTNIVDFSLDKQCCDLRTQSCNQFNVIGYPFSTRDPIYVKVEYIEFDINGTARILTETSIATTITDNNLQIFLKNLNNLNLYKTINNLPARFTSKDSVVDVRVYLSYTNSSYVQWTSFTIYDSKCRTCEEENGQLTFLDEKCEINGVCYNRNETFVNNSLWYCNPDNSNNTWTQIDPLCNGQNEWTQWFNYDTPDGDGDFELYSLFDYGCKNPSVIQVQTIDGFWANETGQVYDIIPGYGFVCFNDLNSDGCLDYQVRQCCRSSQLFSTTTRQTTSFSISSTNFITEELTSSFVDPISFETTEATHVTEELTSSFVDPISFETTEASHVTEELTSSFVDPISFETTEISDASKTSLSIDEITIQTDTPTDTTHIISTTRAQCYYSLNRGSNVLTFKENSNFSIHKIIFEITPNYEYCLHSLNLSFNVKSSARTATELVDYNPIDQWVSFDSNSTVAEFEIEIHDDNLIEPYEYFVLEFSNIESSIQNLNFLKKVYVYIIDNDFLTGDKDNSIYDIFDPELAEPYWYSAFYNDPQMTSIYEVPDNQALFTNQGGFSVNKPKIYIAIQYYGYSFYKLHTVEINNPDQCNIKSFTIRRKNSMGQYSDPNEINSTLIDNVPIVDINFNKLEQNLTSISDVILFMEIKVLSTINGANIGTCEFRAFGEEVQEEFLL